MKYGRVPGGPFYDWVEALLEREREILRCECREIIGDWTTKHREIEALNRLGRKLGVDHRMIYRWVHREYASVDINTVDRICGPLVLNELYPVEEAIAA